MTTEPSATDHVRRSMELLWGGGGRSVPGPKPSLSLAGIVEAAIAVADREGVEGLSMRRVAGELGVGTMTLYRYVPGKAELLALMLDKVSDPTEDIGRAAHLDWRGVIEMAAHGSYRLYLTHPWLLQVNWTRPVIGPNTLAGIELFMRGLGDLGLSDQERISVMLLVDSFVTGAARQRIQHTAVSTETGLGDEEFWAQQEPLLSKAMRSGAYPAMAALSEDAFSAGWEETFEFGLQRLLDGVAALIESRRSESRAANWPAPSRRRGSTSTRTR